MTKTVSLNCLGSSWNLGPYRVVSKWEKVFYLDGGGEDIGRFYRQTETGTYWPLTSPAS